MARITFVLPDGEAREIEAVVGRSLMEAASRHSMPGILAECGGACACATCHVLVDGEWIDRLPAASALETSMLEFVEGQEATSRLSCQIKVTDEMNGLKVRVPVEQGG